MHDTLKTFIKEFETKFTDLLLHPPEGENILYTPYFKIYTNKPKQKYSDWDIKTWAKSSEELDHEIIRQFDSFIRSFQGFTDVGLFMAFSDIYISVYQHVKHGGWLQYMGFMSSESTAPFLDLWIVGPFREEALINSFGNKNDEEMLKWAAITAWRKIKNKDLDGARYIFQMYLSPRYPNQQESFMNDPNSFFLQNIKSETSNDLISFLNN